MHPALGVPLERLRRTVERRGGSHRLTAEAGRNGFVPFADGELTKRGTFQKFYEQHELRDWIGAALGVEPIAAAPGVFYVFRDEVARETLVASRFRPTTR
jgi:DNA phosphorothioation-associated putative methyltransferase